MLLIEHVLQSCETDSILKLNVVNALVVLLMHTFSSVFVVWNLLLAVTMSVLRQLRVVVPALLLGRVEALLIIDKEIHTLAHFVASGWNQSFLAVRQDLHIAAVSFDQLAGRRLVNLAIRVCKANIQVVLIGTYPLWLCFVVHV